MDVKIVTQKNTSYELQLESLKKWVEIQKCKFESTSYEFKSMSSNSRVASSNLRVTSSNI